MPHHSTTKKESAGDIDLGGGTRGTVKSGTENLETVMAMAAEIWDAIKRSGVSEADDDGNDDLIKRLQADYKDFATSYPIPFRWMVQAREYEAGIFEKFILNKTKVMYKDRHEFMTSQGEYLVMLYRRRHPRASGGQLSRYRDSIAKSLKEEDDQFTAAKKEAEGVVEQSKKDADADRRRRMVAYLRCINLEK